MRVFETSHDHSVLPGITMVARLDGRGFTKWTKGAGLEKPFDQRFHKLMTQVTVDLMEHSGLGIVYGYTQSDEISLLLSPGEGSFGRKIRKLNSVLAGCASAFGTHWLHTEGWGLEEPVVFDCRISQLITPQDVMDYFQWRMEDSHRNCLNGYCYWKLRQRGESKGKASRILEGKGTAFKNEMLFQDFGLNYNEDVPLWQRRGSGVFWETFTKEGENPMTGEKTVANRKRLKVDLELPRGDEYSTRIYQFLLGL